MNCVGVFCVPRIRTVIPRHAIIYIVGTTYDQVLIDCVDTEDSVVLYRGFDIFKTMF